MKSRISLPFMMLFIAASLTATMLEAREVFLDADDVAVIRGPRGSHELRLLVKFSMPAALAGGTVDFACATFDASCSAGKHSVSLEAFPITTEWNEGTVSWTEPWANPGGDWNPDMSAEWIMPAGAGKTIYLDITDFVNRWIEEPSTNLGIIVKVSEPFPGTFSVGGPQAPGLRILY